MKFDFDRVIERRGTDSIKWDIADGELPMWVADMDFETAPAILDAIKSRAAHGIYGYADVTDEWADAYRSWWSRRHGLDVERDAFIFCTGVIPAISTAVRKLTTPAEKVVVETPVYNIFFNCVENNGRVVVESPLVYENGAYRRDLDALEEKLSDPQVTMMILCNPHNPTGIVWEKEELRAVGELCRRHNVVVISDEIHCDLTDPGVSYVPFASASDCCRDISITCVAPSKTFNIAGIHSAAVIVPDPALRHRMWRALNTDEVAEPNVFAVTAAVAAFTEGEEWLDALRAYVYENKRYVAELLRESLPEIKLSPSRATYLLWLDVSSFSHDSRALASAIRARTGLYLSNGAQYRGNGNDFLRMNVACPRMLVEDGAARLIRGIRELCGIRGSCE